MSDIILDAKGTPITVGARFTTPKPIFSILPEDQDPDFFTGVVTGTTDADGDVDDEGRSIGIAPTVSVRYDNGDEDTYRATFPIRGWVDYMTDVDAVCDEIEIVKTEHQITYDRPGKVGSRGWQAVCACGWRGHRMSVNGGKALAEAEAEAHLAEQS